MTRTIPLRTGARTPHARVLERKHNDLIKSLASEKTMRTMDDYNTGQLSGFIYALTLSAQPVSSSANNAFRLAKLVRPTGEDARTMIRVANELDAAAECLRRAAEKAFQAPELLQAAE